MACAVVKTRQTVMVIHLVLSHSLWKKYQWNVCLPGLYSRFHFGVYAKLMIMLLVKWKIDRLSTILTSVKSWCSAPLYCYFFLSVSERIFDIDSNLWPTDYRSTALSTRLPTHLLIFRFICLNAQMNTIFLFKYFF
jgi:hypothetical protein